MALRDSPDAEREQLRADIAAATAAWQKKHGKPVTIPIGRSSDHMDGDWRAQFDRTAAARNLEQQQPNTPKARKRSKP